jgi:cytochrome P450
VVTHPDILTIAQKELDTIVGLERMPTFANKPDLPYISALCKEVLRWRPVAVLGGTPHASTENDTYKTFHIPSGTTILGNSWAINLNPEYYPQPHTFDPVRFLRDEELTALGIHRQPYTGTRSHPSQSGHSSFGWGRRICPGADLASNSLFIALARLLWAYEISPCEGVTYDTFAYTEGFNIRPRRFECMLRIRSARHREVVEKEQAESLEWLEKFAPFEE